MLKSVVGCLLVVAACSASHEPLVAEQQQALFDCSDPAQRLTCAPPADPATRFVCHATGSPQNPYNKIEVELDSAAHLPGIADNPHKPADQATGASGNDVGAGSPGLDCECNVRACSDTCTGAEEGAACDDNDSCTADGSCSAGVCTAGAPRCTADAPIDGCHVESGVCDPSSGACDVTQLPAGTSCGANQQCSDAGTCTALHIVINEVESSGGVPGDWLELYNAGSTGAYLGGWIVKDSDDSHSYAIPAATVIAPGGYLVIDEAELGFGLGSGDSARLFDGATLVDSYTWTTHAATSYGRCPNGSGAFRTANSTTKGAANDCAVDVVLNEIESSGGVPGDWVELYNRGTGPADLGGFTFKDSDDTHAYVIASGTTLPAGGYLVLDEAQFGFGLGSADAARLYDAGGTLADAHAWTAHATTTYGRCPNGTGSFVTSTSSTKNAANDCGIGVTINEVESSGGAPGDWVELYNTNATPLDISGWIFRDSDDTHAYAIPAGTTLAPGAYYVLEEAAFGFGLGSADSARLFNGTALVDSYAWTAHAAATYGRCPNGIGAFTATASTKGVANDCGEPPPSQGVPWPGANQVTTIDEANTYGVNLSGLFHDGTDLWAVRNGPATLFRVGGPSWTLRYPNGLGTPDAEDVTLAAGAVYVATERDNDNGAISRPSILRYVIGGGSELVATHEWNVAAALPVIGSNAGLEAITFIPDAFLTTNGFVDQSTNAPYAPAAYPNHAGGLFFVGLETNGQIYAFALDHVTGSFSLVASFASGDVTSKALTFDAASGYLWQHCGVACGGDTRVLVLVGGSFQTKRLFSRPSTMANLQNEGIAIDACVNNARRYYWADDSQTDGHALRTDTIPCAAFIP